MFHDLVNSKKTAISNTVIRSKIKPAEKALYAVLKLVSNPHLKTTYSALKNFLKERRTATENRLSALQNSIKDIPQSDNKSFTLVPIDILLSPALSLSAKGIYMMIRSYATFKGFVIKKDYFLKKSGMGADSFNTAWKELLDCQLLCKQQNRTAFGQFIYTYQLSDLQNTGCALDAPAEKKESESEHAEKESLGKVISMTLDAVRTHAQSNKIESTRPKKEKYIAVSHTPYQKSFRTGQLIRGNFDQREYDDEFWKRRELQALQDIGFADV